MWPGNSVPIIVSALITLVHSLPPSIDGEAFQYDEYSINQNEKILKFFLQLATHTANRLTRLRKETDKYHNCSRHNNNLPFSTTEIVMTQLSSQEGLERLIEHQGEIQDGLTFGDSEKNNNDRSPLENLNQNQIVPRRSSDVKENVTDANIARNSNLKTNNLIPKIVQDIQNTSSFSQNLPTDGISVRLFDSVNLPKRVLNAGNVQPKLRMNQRLRDTDNLIENTSGIKIINDLHENTNNDTPRSQDTEKSLGGISDVNRRFFEPTGLIFSLLGNAIKEQIVNNFPIVDQISSNLKSIRDLLISFLPKTRKNADDIHGDNVTSSIMSDLSSTLKLPVQQARSFRTIQEEQISSDENNMLDTVGASNITDNIFLNQIISQLQNVLNMPSKIREDAKEYSDSNNVWRNVSNILDPISNSSSQDNQTVLGSNGDKNIKMGASFQKTSGSNKSISNNTNTNFSDDVRVISNINDPNFINNKSLTNAQTSPATNILPEISRNHVSSQEMSKLKDNTKQFVHSNYIQHQQTKNMKSWAASKSDNLPSDHPNLVSNAKNNTDRIAHKFEGNNEETRNNNFPKNTDNTKTRSKNDQSTSVSTINQENIPIPQFRLFSDFNEHKNNEERTRNGLSPSRMSKNINNFSSEKSDLEEPKKFQLQNNLSSKWKQDNQGQNENVHELLETELQEISSRLIDALTPVIKKEMINDENY